jgi:hypothetical protein
MIWRKGLKDNPDPCSARATARRFSINPLRRYQRTVGSMLLLALVFASVGPWLQRALLSAGRTSFAEICTSKGLRRIALPSSNDEAPERIADEAAMASHCPFCLAAQHAGLPPTATTLFPVSVATTSDTSPLRLQTAFNEFANPAARPRAPPVVISA